MSPEYFAKLREWIAEKDWEFWDEHLEKDIASGKLEFLREEAEAAKLRGQLSEL